jgi:N-dimethylarginine dimethylaminohydrolase
MKLSDRGYKIIRLPDVLSCNAVVVNGHVLAQDSSCSVSKRRIEGACLERGLGVSFVDTSELAKKDAALTCCSVLLSV